MSTERRDDRASEPRKDPHPSEFVEFATSNLARSRSNVTAVDTEIDGTFTHREGWGQERDSFTEHDTLREFFSTMPETLGPSRGAAEATTMERKMTFYDGCRLYPKAMAWSFLLSCTIIMEGYDTTLINSFYAFPAFRESYGSPAPTTGSSSDKAAYQISPSWQAALTNSAVAGEIVGLFLNGFCTDRFGYRLTMMGALVLTGLFVFPAFFAVNIEMILASQILCGRSPGRE